MGASDLAVEPDPKGEFTARVTQKAQVTVNGLRAAIKAVEKALNEWNLDGNVTSAVDRDTVKSIVHNSALEILNGPAANTPATFIDMDTAFKEKLDKLMVGLSTVSANDVVQLRADIHAIFTAAIDAGFKQRVTGSSPAERFSEF